MRCGKRAATAAGFDALVFDSPRGVIERPVFKDRDVLMAVGAPT
jgi:hypothetical protein